MAVEALIIEGLKLSISAYFQYMREQGKNDAEIKAEFDAIADEGKDYHPDHLIDV